MKYRANAHIWCSGSTSYINALRMGKSESNLGLVLTRGKLESYSIEDCVSNVRGKIILNSAFFSLTAGEETVIEWEIFEHSGNEDFYRILGEYSNTVKVDADYYTVFEDDNIEFTAVGKPISKGTVVILNEKVIPTEYSENTVKVKYKPCVVGDFKFEIRTGENVTYTEFAVRNKLDELIEKRLEYIVNRQQYKNENSPLHGAFLIYDTAEKHPVFDTKIGDHNACHERIGMALLLVKYLQTHDNPNYREALDLYIEFVLREFYDDDTGVVFGSEGKYNERIRLYDSPWVMMLFAEMYFLTHDTKYTDRIVKTVTWYYEKGGAKFYPNGISFLKIMTALKESGNPSYDRVFELVNTHVENIINTGVNYPKHEVNYEQTIVTPAVTHISEMGILTKDKRYTAAAYEHIVNLERFNGLQPSFHLNEIPIRYWDDFWFGKALMMGDTFPHYWSCLTARSYFDYYEISGDEKYLISGRKCIRNCLCLFNECGEGSCAYVYPFMLDNRRGGFYDEWANDQDFALYFTLDSKKYL